MSPSDFLPIIAFQRQKLYRALRRKRVFAELDDDIRLAFPNQSPCVDSFDATVRYLWRAFVNYVDTAGTVAYYPGSSSIYGARNDGIEGVTRLLPLWAAYITSPFGIDTHMVAGMASSIKKALLNGTKPNHSDYWGDISDRSVLICEAADVALSIWLVRDSIWMDFNASQRKQILDWLKQVLGKETANNNWHLFVVFVDVVIADLDMRHRFESELRYERIKSFYLGDGCFTDGPEGGVDFYNAWGFHYLLYWMTEISPGFDGGFPETALADYVGWYQYLFTENGFPLYGRSLCYRMAAPGPLVAASGRSPGFSKSVALSALWFCWKYFVERGALALGRPTQGVFADDLLWLDPYSGPASCFWATRSLTLFYFTSRVTDWRGVEPTQLPASTKDFSYTIRAANIAVRSRSCNSTSEVHLGDAGEAPEVALSKQTIRERLREVIYAKASRPANNLPEKGVRYFSSDLAEYEKH